MSADKKTKILVRQVRSRAGCDRGVIATLKALGLGHIGKSQEFTLNPALRGMLGKVEHLIEYTVLGK